MPAWAWYAVTRALTLAIGFVEPELLADPLTWLVDLDRNGPALAMPQYPWPAVALAHLPMRLGIPTVLHYYAAVVLFMLAVDAMTAWLLWRAGGRRMTPGLALWLSFAPALGPLLFTRFDVLPATLAAAALLTASTSRPGSAGALEGLGTGLKLWPAAALPALLLPLEGRQRVRALAAFAAAGVVLAAATIAAAGWNRLWTPFIGQAARGLQIESLAALPLLWARYFDATGAWTVRFADCLCHEIFGPGVASAVQLSVYFLAVCAIALLLLHMRAFKAPAERRTPVAAALLSALVVIAWIVAARVFSPQYLIWLAALLGVAGALPGGPLSKRDVVLFAIVCLLTQVIYPWGYGPLVNQASGWQAAILLVMTLRDALLIVYAVRFARLVWQATSNAVPAAPFG